MGFDALAIARIFNENFGKLKPIYTTFYKVFGIIYAMFQKVEFEKELLIKVIETIQYSNLKYLLEVIFKTKG